MTANVDGRPLYPSFQFLPSKRRYPEYYNVIDSPIGLKTIAQKIQAGEYSTLTELERDLLRMVRNACLFNEPGSSIYKDAKTLKKVIKFLLLRIILSLKLYIKILNIISLHCIIQRLTVIFPFDLYIFDFFKKSENNNNSKMVHFCKRHMGDKIITNDPLYHLLLGISRITNYPVHHK